MRTSRPRSIRNITDPGTGNGASAPAMRNHRKPCIDPLHVLRITSEHPHRALDPQTQATLSTTRLPRNVQAIYLRPLKRQPTHGVPTCDLQLRSYSVRNVEFFADFALRAAYYLGLPAKGPVPLPRITERWTVPRSNFIFKKSQENFERITLRRLIQIQDGHPDAVKVWLGFLEKHQYHGVGMKANVWEFEGLDVAARMDEEAATASEEMEERWRNFGSRKTRATAEMVEKMVGPDVLKRAAHGGMPMSIQHTRRAGV